MAFPLTEGLWLPGVPVDFSLGVTAFEMPFLLLSQLVACTALWQNGDRGTWGTVPALLFAQFAFTVVFTSQDLILFCAALQGLWLSIAFSAQMEDQYGADRMVPFALVSGALMLASAVILGSLHLDQFQTFSARLPALRELNLPDQAFVGHFTLGEVVFTLMAVATFLMAPVIPAHLWLQSLMNGKSTSAQILVVGTGAALAVFTWLQWMVPVLPDAYSTLSPWFFTVLLGGVVYGAGLALAAADLGQWLTAAAVLQTSLALLGITVVSPESAAGAVIHSLVWPISAVGFVGLFAWMERAFGSRRSEDIGALPGHAPRLAALLALFFLMAIAAPATGLFPSFLLLLTGLVQSHPSGGMIVGVAWGLLVCSVARIALPFFLGGSPHQGIRTLPDLRRRKVALAAVLVLLSIGLGTAPRFLKSMIDPALKSYWKVPLKAQATALPGGRS